MDKKKAKDTETEKEELIPVKAFKVGRFNFEDSLNSLGTIKGGVEFKLSFEIPGVVSAINYREGERYEEGALLVSLRQDDILLRLQRSQAQLSKAEATLAIADEKLKEHEKLFQLGAIPQTTLDKVKLEVDKQSHNNIAKKFLKKMIFYSAIFLFGENDIERRHAKSQMR